MSNVWLKLWFLIQMLVFNFVLGCELTYAILSFKRRNYFEAYQTVGYVGFVFVADLKMLAVFGRKAMLVHLVDQLESVNPKRTEQEQYEVNRYLRRCRLFTKAFAGLYFFLISIYNMMPFTKYAIDRWVRHSSDAVQAMPYFPTTPWNWHDNWGYYATYLLQVWTALASSAGHISADLMIFAVAVQMTMHFDYLAKKLTEMQVQADTVSDGGAKDMEKLQQLIAFHNKILGLTDVMNTVFGWPLLLNFLTSSVVVCLQGVLMTIITRPEQFFKMSLFLLSATVEIFLICMFSQWLIDASASVSRAVYNMNWTSADVRFRRMLVLMALRAQKPVFLRAPAFLDVSMETMSLFLKMSYRFFCVLRTMYQ